MEHWQKDILQSIHKDMLNEYKGMIDATIDSRHSDFEEKMTKLGKLKDKTLETYQHIICNFI